MDEEKNKLKELFAAWAGEEAGTMEAIPGTGSYRRYYRLQGAHRKAIGVFNDDVKENLAFLSFTAAFQKAGFPVPEILGTGMDHKTYLLQDLGDVTLFSRISLSENAWDSPEGELVSIYKSVISWLPRFQAEGAGLLDFSACYPRAAFDRQSMMWDLNYFKYYFLKLAKITFDEQKLEDDFAEFAYFLEKAGQDWFMYRDFQSRNIMLLDGSPWFIDYQGGRKGPLQYDIASLLYDAKADIPSGTREILLEFYLDELEKIMPVDRKEFTRFYYGFVLVRILQALGAYGFRGYYENKPHFLKSIPFAMRNLSYLLEKDLVPYGLPVIREILERLTADPRFTEPDVVQSDLTVSVFSFSYKKMIPHDPGGNGGGFVFDCRALPNPGKFEEYQRVTGMDQPVISFLKKEPEVDKFLNHATALVDQSVKQYMIRGFNSLAVSFGCTGGQHRSVYCAEQLAAHLREKYPIRVVVTHTEAGTF